MSVSPRTSGAGRWAAGPLRLVSATLLGMPLAAGAAAATPAGPQPPCADGARPAYPAPGRSASARVWLGDELDWAPPACTGWRPRPFTALVALAGRFRAPAGAREVLGRFGSVSALTEVLYWSVTRQRWRKLFDRAYALRGPDPGMRRDDFSARELVERQAVYFYAEQNAPVGAVVYRMEVRRFSPDSVWVEAHNARPVSLLLDTLAPGRHELLWHLERESAGVWRYYALVRTGEGGRLLPHPPRASYINRAAALYRHIAGLPTNGRPPLAP